MVLGRTLRTELRRRKRLEVPLDMLLGFGPYVFLLAAIAAVYTFVSPQSGGNQDSFGLRVAVAIVCPIVCPLVLGSKAGSN